VSIHALQWAFSLRHLAGLERSVLVALAWKDGGQRMPSIAELQELTGWSLDSIQRALGSLAALGLIVLEKTPGRRHSIKLETGRSQPPAADSGQPLPAASDQPPTAARLAAHSGHKKDKTEDKDRREPVSPVYQPIGEQEEQPEGHLDNVVDLPLSKTAQAGRRPKERKPLGRRLPGQPRIARPTSADQAVVDRYRAIWNTETAKTCPPMPAVSDPRLILELAEGLRAYSDAEQRQALQVALRDPWYLERLSPRFAARMLSRLLLDQKAAPREAEEEPGPVYRPVN